MKYKILSFIIALVIALQSFGSLTVYASSKGGGGVSRPASKTDTTGFNDWSTSDKFKWYSENIISVIGGVVGCIFVPSNWNYDYFMSTLQSMAIDKGIANDSADFEEYLVNRLSKNDDGNIVVQDDLADLMYDTTNIYIEECTGYYLSNTVNWRNISSLAFDTKEDYEMFTNFCKKNLNGTDKVVAGRHFTDISSNDNTIRAFTYFDYGSLSDLYFVFNFYDDSDNLFSAYTYRDWQLTGSYEHIWCNDNSHSVDELFYNNYGFLGNFISRFYCVFITDGTRTVRVYKTVDDMKTYSVGQRPYYVTSQYTNYNTGDDNTCTISDSQLENSSVYGDVYNYINNNYDNPDALTEDELRQILDEYFGRYNPPSGTDNPSGGGSGSGSSGGSGLSDFLSGLGSLGDGILSILGKLLEYIGKAVDLLSGTVTKIIDVIPNNITNLIGALFPFIPEEWLVAVELSLVLAVIAGVIKIFKG